MKSHTKSRHWVFYVVQTLSAAVLIAVVIVVLNKSAGYEGGSNHLKLSASPREFDSEQQAESPVVQTLNGKVRGTTLTSRLGREFNAFYRIPYAQPPIGELRFQSPKAFTEKWDGVRDATQRGGSEDACVQFRFTTLEGKEDCLKLSVFTPKLPSEENPQPNLPVMVYIFGGSFTFGRSNRYGPDYIMDEDVILVLFDFRIGAFGHLNTEDSEIRGNMALKDQVMALKWIQANIHRFGGDPKRVLIFGNSSGAAYIHSHVISRMSTGLFSRAVSQSGSVYLNGGYQTTPSESARSLGTKLNCSDVDDTKKLHRCLIDADLSDIAMKFNEVQMDFSFMSKEIIPDGDSSDVFFEDYPINLSVNGTVRNAPWLVGNNNAESFPTALSILSSRWTTEVLNTDWNRLAPLLLNFNDDYYQTNSHLIKQAYFGTKKIGNQTRYELVDLFSDSSFVYPVKRAADNYAKNGGAVYYYYMTHEPISGYGDLAKGGFAPPFGATHADEVQFLFPFTNEINQKFPYIDQESVDFQVSRNIIKIWTGFARDGVPSIYNVKTWPKLSQRSPSETSWMEINSKCSIRKPRKELDVLTKVPINLPVH